jgi:hypothetical protein
MSRSQCIEGPVFWLRPRSEHGYLALGRKGYRRLSPALEPKHSTTEGEQLARVPRVEAAPLHRISAGDRTSVAT